MREKLSAFVITYNRASLLESCLRAVSFADEVVVIDKSSTDHTAAVAARYADRVECVPWSPTVEETRAFAVSLCRHEWLLCLDDDEILSPATGRYLTSELTAWDADIYSFPYRHYILGVHDERAYYWPETRHCLFRKGAVEFIPTVHGGVVLQSDRVTHIPVETGVCIHHLSYQDVAGWIERSNRYTSRPNRVRAEAGPSSLIQFGHEQIDHWMRRTADSSGDDYPAAVALLRAIYDMVDRLKSWETERGIDGAEMFRVAQRSLAPAIEERRPGAARRREDDDTDACEAAPSIRDSAVNRPAGLSDSMAMQGLRVQLLAAEAQLRERTAAAQNSVSRLVATRHELAETTHALAAARHECDDTRETLRQTRVALDQTRAALNGTEAQLSATSTALIDASQQFERVSSSGRVFLRQYLPKLRRHLARRVFRTG